MRGHIRERSPGHWAIVIDVRDPQTGKRKRRWRSFQGTKLDAQVECARLISELNGGTHVDPCKITLAEFLDRWLAHMQSHVSPRTHERLCKYRGLTLRRSPAAVGTARAGFRLPVFTTSTEC
jgi:hypothetical protein